jgi:hypothetical protein
MYRGPQPTAPEWPSSEQDDNARKDAQTEGSNEINSVQQYPESTYATVEYTKHTKGVYSSASRKWVLWYSVLTWCMTLAFFIVVLVAYGGVIDQDPKSSLQKRGIIQSIGCLRRKSFNQWNHVFKLYEEYFEVYTTKNQTQLVSEALSAMLCQSHDTDVFAYASMQCKCVLDMHNDVFVPKLNVIKTSTADSATKAADIKTLGRVFAVDGNKTSGDQSIMSMCFFAHRPSQWIEPYQDGCWTQVVPYGMIMFLNTVAGCFAGLYFIGFWGRREQQPGKDAPETTTANVNAASVAVVNTPSNEADSSSSTRSTRSTIQQKAMRWVPLGAFLCLNLVMGLWSIIISFQSQPSDPNQIMLGGYLFAYLMIVIIVSIQMNAMLASMFPSHEQPADSQPQSTQPPAQANAQNTQAMQRIRQQGMRTIGRLRHAFSKLQNKVLLQDNIYLIMRMVFWGQYILSLPVVLLLYDGLNQSRDPTYQHPRIIYILGLGFLALAFDISLAIHERMQMDIFISQEKSMQLKKEEAPTMLEQTLMLTVATGDSAKLATWWGWMIWTGLAASVFVMAKPLNIPSQLLESMIPGSTSTIAVGTILYILGMPLVSRVPGLNIDCVAAFSWMEDRHSISLALCLLVDFFARTLLTLSAVYWLLFDV